MADVDLNFLARQTERVLSNIGILQGVVELVCAHVARIEDDIGVIKSDLQGLHADMIGLRADNRAIRAEITALRHDMRSGFETLDARLRPLETD